MKFCAVAEGFYVANHLFVEWEDSEECIWMDKCMRKILEHFIFQIFCLQQTRARDLEGHQPLLAGKLVYAKQPGIVTWECVETGFWGICWKYRRVSTWQVTITFIVLIIVFHRICGLTRTFLSISSLHFIKYPMLCGGSRGVACLRPFLHHHN